ncbi:hypothetical protein [Ruegeria sp. MALMAid1280]|uniref:hypothetical protein n=1 Tax=Ruegeria sp. MALMAid1280 TaxID=3411634 RepID=UPI003B9E4FA8
MQLSNKVAAACLGVLILSPPVATADTSIYLPDPQFAPEGIAVSSDGSLFIGSLTQGRMVRISPQTKSVTEFAPAGENGMVSVLGVHISTDDKLVFACSSDPGSSALTGTAAPALVSFDLETGASAGRYELPEGGALCNDITELPDGTILATDSFVPRIYALRPGANRLEIWLEDEHLSGEGFNFNGIAYDDGAVFILRYNAGTMHRIPVLKNKTAGDAVAVALPKPIKAADGLKALGDGRFLVVEGGGLAKGARGALLGVTVDNTNRATVETLAGDLNVPTTVDTHGDAAYVVEGQLDHLFDPTAGPADPYRLIRIDLPDAFQGNGS